MKTIAMRALNLMPIWAAVGFVDWIYELIEEGRFNSSLYVALGILGIDLAINYVFFGKITVWHKNTLKESKS